jgi:hemerythrin-like domain-containing protein
MAGSDAVCLRELTTALAAEHRQLEANWARVRQVLARVADGANTGLDAAEVATLVEGYQRHIEREESELLPMAARLLGDDALDRIGRAMRTRRGIPLPD